jgi:membrane-associated phospholipid phosphatase
MQGPQNPANRATPTGICARALLLGSYLLSGCTTLPNGHGWGEDATYRPGWERVKTSATGAARDPWVWAPLLATGVLQIDSWDRKVSDWAREHTPVFGSQENAERWSDDLKSASAVAYHISVLATPSGPDTGDWLQNKAQGYLVGGTAIWLTSKATQGLKAAADRERPNGQGHDSFPSGHTSASAVYTQLASRNLRAMDFSKGVHRTLDAGLDALTLGTSWARIEAGWHFPADTLFSIALGNFLGSFLNDAFMGLDTDSQASLAFQVSSEGALVRWRVRF